MADGNERARMAFIADPKDLDELRAWAAEWNHLEPLATQVYHLFEEWDAANRECDELRRRVALLEVQRA